jgi:hypothetical protein
MESLFREILNKLNKDPRVKWGCTRVSAPVTYKYSVWCPDECGCKIIFKDISEWQDPECKDWLDYAHLVRCESGCADILLGSLPPVDTFLQRRALADVLAVGNIVKRCLCCIRKYGDLFIANLMCAGCYRAHKQEESALMEKRMIMCEVLGEDCAGVVAGYLLYFFARVVSVYYLKNKGLVLFSTLV